MFVFAEGFFQSFVCFICAVCYVNIPRMQLDWETIETAGGPFLFVLKK